MSVKREPCTPLGNCDFEGGLCGYTNVPDEYKNRWEWEKAEDASDGVLVDHTTNTGTGKLLYHDQIVLL